MHRWNAFGLLAFLLIPVAASAMSETVFDFRGGQIPMELRISGLDEPQPTSDGLHITASVSDGGIYAAIALPAKTQTVTMTFASTQETPARFLWHRPGMEDGMLVQLPFTIPVSPEGESVSLNLSAYPEWDGTTDALSLTFPRGTNVLLQDIRFRRWNIVERMREMWTSFWMFDNYRPTSINFVWGPVVTFNPVATQELYLPPPPPKGRSANWFFYGALLLIGIGLAGWTFRRKENARRALVLFFCCFGIFWMIHDIRMGLELLGYARHDYESYIAAPPGNRELRTYLHFNDMMEQLQPLLSPGARVGLVTAPGITPMTRYFAFPALVTEVKEPHEDIALWVVFQRDDVAIAPDGRLTVEGIPWSRPGKIVKKFDETSFLFQTSE